METESERDILRFAWLTCVCLSINGHVRLKSEAHVMEKSQGKTSDKTPSKHAKPSKKKPIAIICVLVIAVIGVGAYIDIIKPHDDAMAAYNAAAEQVRSKNAELESAVSDAQAVLDSGETPLDSTTTQGVEDAISAAYQSERSVADPSGSNDDILKQADDLSQPLDYSSEIDILKRSQVALETSINQYKMLTNPSEDTVVAALKKVSGVYDVAAATEGNDPNQELHKDGGYTSDVFFSVESLSSNSSVKSGDAVAKGTPGGGCVEVYSTTEDADKRNTYLAAFDGSILSGGSHAVYGTCVVRTSSLLTASEQKTLEANVVTALTAS